MGGGDDFWELVAANEYGAVLIATAPLSSATSAGPTSFAAWAVQGPAEAESI